MDKMQFEKGQTIAYGTNGICIIDEIKPMRITSDSKPEQYYVLKLKRDMQSKVFVPVLNEALTAKMRKPMSREEVDRLLKGAKGEQMIWDSDRRARTDRFRDILLDGVSHDLLCMVMCLYERKRVLDEDGKKLPVTDSNTLKSAVRLLEEEVGHALGIEQDDVRSYIKSKLELADDIV